MIYKLLLLPLAFWFAFPSFAGAAVSIQKDAALPASFYCASARQIAEGYVLLIQEKYANQEKDPDYIDARLKYQIAAAKFSGLRSTIELEMIGGSRVPNVNDAKFQPMVTEALGAFSEFQAAARKIVTSSHGVISSQAFEPLNVSALLTEVVSFISRFQELWVKHDQIRETRLKKLSDWIDEYYKWRNWDDIGKPAPSL